MKPNFTFKAICLSLVLSLYSISTFSQCADNATPQTVSYDSTVFGGGNDEFNFTFPQFDPNLGTLISVNLATTLTLKYSFQLENHNHSASNHTVRVTRIDELTFPGGGAQESDRTNLGPYLLQGSDGVPGSGPDYIEDGPLYAFKNLQNSYNLTSNLAGFLGSGAANIGYITNSLANSVSNLNSTLRGNASDTVRFVITYSFCPTAFLPAGIMQFSASKISSAKIDLRWIAPNDVAGTKYEIEKSVDGRKFVKFESIISTSNVSNNYQAKYQILNEDNKKLFFRVRETSTNGEVKISQVKIVNIPDNFAGHMKLYPTVSSGTFSISFQEGSKEDWNVSIYSMAGNIVEQSIHQKTNFVHYTAKTPMKPGIYFVTAENIKTKEIQKSKIIIQ